MPQLRGAKYADGSIIRSAAISLDGALDYEMGDREEWTMELSLWAEGFRDMLCCQYGMAIYHALSANWWALLVAREMCVACAEALHELCEAALSLCPCSTTTDPEPCLRRWWRDPILSTTCLAQQ